MAEEMLAEALPFNKAGWEKLINHLKTKHLFKTESGRVADCMIRRLNLQEHKYPGLVKGIEGAKVDDRMAKDIERRAQSGDTKVTRSKEFVPDKYDHIIELGRDSDDPNDDPEISVEEHDLRSMAEDEYKIKHHNMELPS